MRKYYEDNQILFIPLRVSKRKDSAAYYAETSALQFDIDVQEEIDNLDANRDKSIISKLNNDKIPYQLFQKQGRQYPSIDEWNEYLGVMLGEFNGRKLIMLDIDDDIHKDKVLRKVLEVAPTYWEFSGSGKFHVFYFFNGSNPSLTTAELKRIKTPDGQLDMEIKKSGLTYVYPIAFRKSGKDGVKVVLPPTSNSAINTISNKELREIFNSLIDMEGFSLKPKPKIKQNSQPKEMKGLRLQAENPIPVGHLSKLCYEIIDNTPGYRHDNIFLLARIIKSLSTVIGDDVARDWVKNFESLLEENEELEKHHNKLTSAYDRIKERPSIASRLRIEKHIEDLGILGPDIPTDSRKKLQRYLSDFRMLLDEISIYSIFNPLNECEIGELAITYGYQVDNLVILGKGFKDYTDEEQDKILEFINYNEAWGTLKYLDSEEHKMYDTSGEKPELTFEEVDHAYIKMNPLKFTPKDVNYVSANFDPRKKQYRILPVTVVEHLMDHYNVRVLWNKKASGEDYEIWALDENLFDVAVKPTDFRAAIQRMIGSRIGIKKWAPKIIELLDESVRRNDSLVLLGGDLIFNKNGYYVIRDMKEIINIRNNNIIPNNVPYKYNKDIVVKPNPDSEHPALRMFSQILVPRQDPDDHRNFIKMLELIGSSFDDNTMLKKFLILHSQGGYRGNTQLAKIIDKISPFTKTGCKISALAARGDFGYTEIIKEPGLKIFPEAPPRDTKKIWDAIKNMTGGDADTGELKNVQEHIKVEHAITPIIQMNFPPYLTEYDSALKKRTEIIMLPNQWTHGANESRNEYEIDIKQLQKALNDQEGLEILFNMAVKAWNDRIQKNSIDSLSFPTTPEEVDAYISGGNPLTRFLNERIGIDLESEVDEILLEQEFADFCEENSYEKYNHNKFISSLNKMENMAFERANVGADKKRKPRYVWKGMMLLEPEELEYDEKRRK